MTSNSKSFSHIANLFSRYLGFLKGFDLSGYINLIPFFKNRTYVVGKMVFFTKKIKLSMYK